MSATNGLVQAMVVGAVVKVDGKWRHVEFTVSYDPSFCWRFTGVSVDGDHCDSHDFYVVIPDLLHRGDEDRKVRR